MMLVCSSSNNARDGTYCLGAAVLNNCGTQFTPRAAQTHMGECPHTGNRMDIDSAAAGRQPDHKSSHQEELLPLLLRKLPATACAHRWYGLLLLVCLLLLLFLLLGRARPLSSLPAVHRRRNSSNVFDHVWAAAKKGRET
jgi:hypothetical protein